MRMQWSFWNPLPNQALEEINIHLLLDTGKVVATGLRRGER